MTKNQSLVAEHSYDTEASTDAAGSSLKHKASTEVANPRKKRQHIDTDYPLDFEARSDLPGYVPESLVIPESTKELIDLPIYFQQGGKTIRIHCDYQPGSDDESFWKHVAKSVKQFE